MRKMASSADLMERAAEVRRAAIVAALAASMALVFALLLIEPVRGIVDVHVPEGGRYLLLGYPGLLPAGEPYVVGKGIGRIPQMLTRLLYVGTFAAAALTVWALVRRHKQIATGAIVWLLVMQVAGPIPMTMQPTPPIAISARTARALLPLNPDRDAAWARYMRAQLAFIDDDRGGAAQLAAGLDEEAIASPIEGAYRLQYLQGRPIAVSTVCFQAGCLSPATRIVGQAFAIAVLVVAGVGSLAAVALLRLLKVRMVRIEGLAARGRRARLTA